MGKYRVTQGQNIYDVALHLYGSIEGIVDLMACNSTLSLSDTLRAGQELEYSDELLFDADAAAYFRTYTITPASGESHVYPKYFSGSLRLEALLPAEHSAVTMSLSGYGTAEIDWGDNSLVEVVSLSSRIQALDHTFDNAIPCCRRIRIYGQISLQTLDISGLRPSAVYLLQPFEAEEVTLKNATLDIASMALLRGTYKLNLHALTCVDLRPLVACSELKELDISGGHINSLVVDDYLQALVREYGQRRSCRVVLPAAPTGAYQEPPRDHQMRYAPANGMEAMWVILHEQLWNEPTAWEFVINDKSYTPDNE